MFIKAQNNIINITRGDSGKFEVILNLGTTFKPEIYSLAKYDRVYFGLSEYDRSFEHAILKRVLTADDYVIEGNEKKLYITLDSNDTVHLMPGVYFYEVKLEKIIEKKLLDEDTISEVHTIIPRTKFIIS